MTRVLLLWWWVLHFLIVGSFAIPFSPCTPKVHPESRVLHIITCDTRTGYKEYQGLALWNVSTHDLRRQGVVVRNICNEGVTWEGFITKPTRYLAYVESQLKLAKPAEASQLYAILMDSDTLFSGVTSVSTLWNAYDCVIGGAVPKVVLGAETSCWIGQFCTHENITEYYGDLATAPSYSPFWNSGIMMGPLQTFARMLGYVLEHKAQYTLLAPHLDGKSIFEDQFAITNYCLKVSPGDCTLDYHQQLAASYALNFQSSLQEVVSKKWTFVCRTQSNEVSYNCPDVTWKVIASGLYYVNPSTCAVTREYSAGRGDAKARNTYKGLLQTLAPTAPIYHGNGFGKKAFLRGLARESFDCMLRSRMQMNSSTYYLHETYEQLYNLGSGGVAQQGTSVVGMNSQARSTSHSKSSKQGPFASGDATGSDIDMTYVPQTISVRRPELKSKKFYIYPLDEKFWWRWPVCPAKHLYSSYRQNSGIGAIIDEPKGLFDSFQHSLFNSFFLRLQRSHRRTLDPTEASLFIIPYDYSLSKRTALDCRNKRRNRTYCPEEMQYLGEYIPNTPQFKRYNGVDHVLITSLGGPFTDSCAGLFEACAECVITSYWVEPNGNESNFVSIPFPSYYHFQAVDSDSSFTSVASPGASAGSVKHGGSNHGVFMPWKHPKRMIFSTYAGSKGVMVRESTLIRKQLVQECSESSHCQYIKVDRVWSKVNDIVETEVAAQLTVEIMTTYANSVFCFCPPGDDPSRRALIDILVSGCIPVVFSPLTLHNGQYPWYIGEESASRYSVFVPPAVYAAKGAGAMPKGVVEFLRGLDSRIIKQKLHDISLLSPLLQYSVPPVKHLQTPSVDIVLESKGLSGRFDSPFEDAMDVAVDGMIDRAERGIFNREVVQGDTGKRRPMIPGLRLKTRKQWEQEMTKVIY